MSAITEQESAIVLAMKETLSRQRAAQLKDGAPSATLRTDRLNRCIALLVDRRAAIEEAVAADFGTRSRHATAFADIAGSIGPLKHARDHLAGWMQTERRATTPRISKLPTATALTVSPETFTAVRLSIEKRISGYLAE